MLIKNSRKALVASLVAGTAWFGSVSGASAATIYSDDFNRTASSTLGLGWTEREDDADDVAIVSLSGNGAMRLRDAISSSSIDAAALQGTVLNTTGYTGIEVTFDYRRISSSTSTSSKLFLAWAPSGTNILTGTWTFVPLAGFTSSSDTFVNSGVISLVGATGNIDIRLSTTISGDTDEASSKGFYVDNLVVSGTAVAPVPGPVVGAGLPGLLIAFGGLAMWYRRRQQSSLI